MRFFKKAVSALALAGLLVALAPTSAFAATQSAPSNLDLVDGIYTNDTTPTATWTRPNGATWYEILVDDGSWYGIGNVGSYTLWTLPDGWHTLYVRAHNNSGGISTSASVTFEIDTVGPTVSTVSPSTAVEDVATTFAVTSSGESATTFCDLYINGSNTGGMTKYSTTSFKKSYTFSTDGSYTVYARCADGDGNYTSGASRTVTVSDADDEETFVVPAVSPSSATEDESETFSVTPYGTLDATSCRLYVSGSSVGTMTQSGSTFRLNYTFVNDGSYTVYAYCKNEHGDWVKGTSRTVTVEQADDNADSLDVPTVSPSTAEEDERTEFTVKPTSDYNVTDCWLYVDGSRVATMDEESRNVFTADYTFSRDGSYSVYAYCKDSSGDAVTGDKRTVRVTDSHDYGDDGLDDADRGSLIKTVCGTTATSTDPCKAVYYYGDDGKRHVFPNEAVYFTWYNDFDDVVEVSGDFMSSLTIGKNVTFRPGSVLVKFETSSSIYAVEKERTLRRYTSTSLIKSDYGSSYTDVLVTVSDSLFGNYVIGDTIDSTQDFDRDDEYYSVDDIDDVL